MDKYKLGKKLDLIKAMFGFKKKSIEVDEYQGPFPPVRTKEENSEKRGFLEWFIKLNRGLEKTYPKGLSLDYIGNNTWTYKPDKGYVKKFIVLKDMTQRQQPHIRYGKVNDQWVKLEHDGFYIIEDQEFEEQNGSI